MEAQEPPFDPYRPPEAEVLPPHAHEEALEALPWEDEIRHPAFWARLGAMFTLAFSSPASLGDRVQAGSGLLRPWTFVLALSAPILLLMVLIFGAMGAFFGILFKEGPKDLPAWIFPLVALALLVVMPLLSFVQMLIWGLLNHACLWMWGGLRQGAGLEHTIRLTGYTLAFFTLGSMIPLVNYVVFLAVPVVGGLAQARLHRTEPWRGVCAALTPVALCCLSYVGWIAVVLTLAPKGLQGLR